MSPKHIFFDLTTGFVAKPEGDRRVQVGSLTTTDVNGVSPTTEMLSVDLDEMSPTFSKIAERFPLLSDQKIYGQYAGLYDVTPDWSPIIGRSTMIDNLYNAVGMSGHGFKLSPAIGALVSEMILEGKSEDNLFREKRFERTEVLRNEGYQYGVLN